MPPGRPRRPPSDERPPFAWIGGALCLDFVNTVSWREVGVQENEHFRTAGDLADWAVAAGLEPEPPALDEHVIRLAHELRLGLHELMLDLARNEPVSGERVAWLNHWVRLSGDQVRIAPQPDDGPWTWVSDRASAAFDPNLALMARIIRSAVDLLQSPERSLLRVCANDRCGWLFLDRSRRRNRRWCEMRECGGRAKARRYRSRRRADPALAADESTGRARAHD